MEVNRIFSAEQIEVHPELPGMLKEYTKGKQNALLLLHFSSLYLFFYFFFF